MAKTNIEWTDAVWNPVTGCTKVSQGCKNCYAETIANRFWKDRKFTDVVCHEDRLEQPLHWKKPRMIFVNSMSDLFHEDVPFEFIDKVFAMMWITQQHIYQILTKRPLRMLRYIAERGYDMNIDKNIWLGVSVEDQKTADERIPILLETPAAVRWISIEPLLEDISSSFMRWTMEMEGWIKTNEIWIVVGGESGPKARGCNIEWIREIVNICKLQNIPVFVKQLGSNPAPYPNFFDKKSKNNEIWKFPEDLQIREYPKIKK